MMKAAIQQSLKACSSALMREIFREKQASREADARDLRSGRRSRQHLERDNSIFYGQHWRVDFASAKRLW